MVELWKLIQLLLLHISQCLWICHWSSFGEAELFCQVELKNSANIQISEQKKYNFKKNVSSYSNTFPKEVGKEATKSWKSNCY